MFSDIRNLHEQLVAVTAILPGYETPAGGAVSTPPLNSPNVLPSSVANIQWIDRPSGHVRRTLLQPHCLLQTRASSVPVSRPLTRLLSRALAAMTAGVKARP
jgi:hypothetical protein